MTAHPPPYVSEVQDEEVVEEEEDEEAEYDEEEEDGTVYDEDPFAQMLVSSEGETIPDVLSGIRGSLESLAALMDKQTKILFKIATHLAKER